MSALKVTSRGVLPHLSRVLASAPFVFIADGELAGLLNLSQRDGAVFPGTAVGGLDEGHGVEVVACADGRFFAGLECDQQLRHGADEGVGEPTLCLLYTSPSPRDATLSRMPSSA